MFPVKASTIPDGALLREYLRDGAYADCYFTDVSGAVSHSRFVTAFYTTAVFKLERLVLRVAASRPSTDAQVKALAAGTTDEFAAWRVENRCEDQLLLADVSGRTRSWLMIDVREADGETTTRLYFGSAVVPKMSVSTGRASLGAVFRMLLGFHKLYSMVLLLAARSRLKSSNG